MRVRRLGEVRRLLCERVVVWRVLVVLGLPAVVVAGRGRCGVRVVGEIMVWLVVLLDGRGITLMVFGFDGKLVWVCRRREVRMWLVMLMLIRLMLDRRRGGVGAVAVGGRLQFIGLVRVVGALF